MYHPMYQDDLQARIDTADTSVHGLLARNHRYKWIKQLESSFNGSVELAHDTITKENVALRLIERGWDAQQSKLLMREVVNHQDLGSHPHIVEFKGSFLTERHLVVVMEYVHGVTLQRFMSKIGGKVSESVARFLLQQVVIAVDYLHRKGKAHRDIKLSNLLVMLVDGQLPLVKVSDFGCSKDALLHSAPVSQVGTALFAAPEVMRNFTRAEYDGRAVDVWACGVVLYILLFGRHPFLTAEDGELPDMQQMLKLFQRLSDPSHKLVTDEQRRFSPGASQLVERMLDLNPETRMTIPEIMMTPWFREDLPPGAFAMNEVLLKTPKTTPLETMEGVKAMVKAGERVDLNKVLKTVGSPLAVARAPADTYGAGGRSSLQDEYAAGNQMLAGQGLPPQGSSAPGMLPIVPLQLQAPSSKPALVESRMGGLPPAGPNPASGSHPLVTTPWISCPDWSSSTPSQQATQLEVFHSLDRPLVTALGSLSSQLGHPGHGLGPSCLPFSTPEGTEATTFASQSIWYAPGSTGQSSPVASPCTLKPTTGNATARGLFTPMGPQGWGQGHPLAKCEPAPVQESLWTPYGDASALAMFTKESAWQDWGGMARSVPDHKVTHSQGTHGTREDGMTIFSPIKGGVQQQPGAPRLHPPSFLGTYPGRLNSNPYSVHQIGMTTGEVDACGVQQFPEHELPDPSGPMTRAGGGANYMALAGPGEGSNRGLKDKYMNLSMNKDPVGACPETLLGDIPALDPGPLPNLQLSTTSMVDMRGPGGELQGGNQGTGMTRSRSGMGYGVELSLRDSTMSGELGLPVSSLLSMEMDYLGLSGILETSSGREEVQLWQQLISETSVSRGTLQAPEMDDLQQGPR